MEIKEENIANLRHDNWLGTIAIDKHVAGNIEFPVHLAKEIGLPTTDIEKIEITQFSLGNQELNIKLIYLNGNEETKVCSLDKLFGGNYDIKIILTSNEIFFK